MRLRDKWSSIRKNLEEMMGYSDDSKKEQDVMKTVESVSTFENHQVNEENPNKPTYNLNLNINDIPTDKEIFITIGQANEQINLMTDGQKLILKRNDFNKELKK